MSRQQPYFYLAECPADGCSKPAWKKAAVWGWTVEEAKAQLVRHLTVSGLHELDNNDAEAIAELQEWNTGAWEEKQAPKRGRSDAASASAASVVAETIRQLGARIEVMDAVTWMARG